MDSVRRTVRTETVNKGVCSPQHMATLACFIHVWCNIEEQKRRWLSTTLKPCSSRAHPSSRTNSSTWAHHLLKLEKKERTRNICFSVVTTQLGSCGMHRFHDLLLVLLESGHVHDLLADALRDTLRADCLDNFDHFVNRTRAARAPQPRTKKMS